MVFFYNANGDLLSLTPKEIYQGSNKANTIYFVCPTAPTSAVSVAFKLPNGEFTTPESMKLAEDTGIEQVVDSNGNKYYLWFYELPIAVTSYKGNVTVQFFIATPESTIATQSAVFMVSKGVTYIEPEQGDTYLDVLEQLSSLQTQIKGIDTSAVENKLDKIYNTTRKTLAYIVTANNAQYYLEVLSTPMKGALAQFTENSTLKTQYPAEGDDCVPLFYLNEQLDLIKGIKDIKVVDELPTSDISTTTLYLLKQADGTCLEYLYVDGVWEQIGSTAVNITVDTELSTESENPVENKVITEELNKKVNVIPNNSGINKVYVQGKGAPYLSGIMDATPLVGYITQWTSRKTLVTENPTHSIDCVNLRYFNANIGHRYKFTLTRTDNASIKYYLYHDTKNNIDTVTNTAIVDILNEFNNIPTLAYMSPFDGNPSVSSDNVPYGVLALKAAVNNGDGTPISINISGYINKINHNSDGLETEFLSFVQVSVTMEKIY